MVLARLGRHADALREARWLGQWEAEHRDEQVGDPGRAGAFILASAGEVPAALAELERVFTAPSLVTMPYLRLEVTWDTVIRDPRFEAVFQKHADPGK